MNLGNNYFFHKGICRVYFGDRNKDAVTIQNSAHKKHAFLEKTMNISKLKKIVIRKEVTLG